jgi:hypothetical protein
MHRCRPANGELLVHGEPLTTEGATWCWQSGHRSALTRRRLLDPFTTECTNHDRKMPNPDIAPVSVCFEGSVTLLSDGEELTFGRLADVVVDSDNRMLHRVLGRVRSDGGRCWLSNVGTSIALVVSDLDGTSYARLTPGGSMPLPFARSAVAFSAGRANYRLTIEHAGLQTPIPLDPRVVVAERTVTASHLVFNDDQLALLGALARQRRTESASSSSTRRHLAQQLGWSQAKLGRKLDHLCIKLARAGVQGLVGVDGRAATQRQQVLADAAIELGLVAVDPPG